MKKIITFVAATALALGMGVATAAPSNAYTAKQNKVWSFVKANAPYGANVIGKADTIEHARITCTFLKSGYDFYDLEDINVNSSSDLTAYQAEKFMEWSAATQTAAVWFLCPGQKYKLNNYLA